MENSIQFQTVVIFFRKREAICLIGLFVDNQLKGMESFIFPLRKLFVYLITKHNFANTMIRVNNYSINKNFVKLHHHQKPRHQIYDGIIFFKRCCLLYFSYVFPSYSTLNGYFDCLVYIYNTLHN